MRNSKDRQCFGHWRPPMSEPVEHWEEQGEAATPPGVGWSGTGQSQEGEREHPDFSKEPYVAGRQSRIEPLWRKEVRLSGTGAWKAPCGRGLSLFSPSCLRQRPWPGSPLGEWKTLDTRVEAENRERSELLSHSF